MLDAVVVGAGPNGLTAAVTIARAGHSVLVLEAEDTIGGGTRTQELTIPGVRHDVCSAVHPLGAASPVFRALPLADHGLAWVHPEVPLAHPRDDAPAALLHRSVDATAVGLDQDEERYRRLVGRVADDWHMLVDLFLGPMVRIPRHPLAAARFGITGVRPATSIARRFEGGGSRALLAGLAAHAIAPLETPFTAGLAVVLAAAAHRAGWPFAAGGSAAITAALAGYLEELGGVVETGRPISSLDDLPPARATLFDTAGPALADLAGRAVPPLHARALRRARRAPGVFKADWTLSGPIPWSDPGVGMAGTVHVGGEFEEIAAAEAATVAGRMPERPFVLLAQPSVVDPTRAPDGQHVVWAYCHVPHGWPGDAAAAIEAQIERFAPGFSSRIIARSTMGTAAMEAHNRNYTGGDITTGAVTALLPARPRLRPDPYRVPGRDLYLCSSATPPGPGVHGMSGYHAARSALRHSLT